MCSELFGFIVNIYFMLLILTSIILFSILLTIHLKICKVFHPFFRILFAEIILAYIICAVGVFIQIQTTLGFIPEVPYIDSIVDLSYAVIAPLFLACVIDRLLATIFYKRYETDYNEFWIVFGVLQILVALVASLQCFTGAADMLTDYCLIYISLVTLVFLFLLIYINTNLTRNDSKRRESISVSQRFQLIENLRIVKNALIPIIAIDLLTTLIDIIMHNTFHTQFFFEVKKCQNSYMYAPVRITVYTVSMFLEFSVPLIVFLRWGSFRKVFLSWFLCCTKVSKTNRINKIKNVFGEVVQTKATQQDYFNQLKDQWK